MGTKKNRTIGRSFRIKEQLLEILEEEAKKEGISPNALMNRILQGYCQFYRHENNFPIVILAQPTLYSMINACSTEDVRNIGVESGRRTLDLMKTLGLRVNGENVIYVIESILGQYGKYFIYTHHIQDNKDVFHLRHNYGEKWSTYVAEVISGLFENLGKKIEIEFLESALTVKAPLDKPL